MYSQTLNSITATIFHYPGDRDILLFSTIHLTSFQGFTAGEPSRTDFVALAVLDPDWGGGDPGKINYLYLGKGIDRADTISFNIFVQGGSRLVGHNGVPSGQVNSDIHINIFAREIVDLGQPK